MFKVISYIPKDLSLHCQFTMSEEDVFSHNNYPKFLLLLLPLAPL